MKDKQDLPLTMDEQKNINSRRGFFKKAALGGSVIATISSRPVWAGQCSISGNLSNNTSNFDQGEICSIKGYSHGSWGGNHNAARFYSFISSVLGPISLETALMSVIPSAYCPKSFEEAPIPKIKDALGNRAGGDTSKLGVPRNRKGLWQQRTTAMLNLLLWEALKKDCENGESCRFDSLTGMEIVSEDFYFDLTVAEIFAMSGSELSNLHSI